MRPATAPELIASCVGFAIVAAALIGINHKGRAARANLRDEGLGGQRAKPLDLAA